MEAQGQATSKPSSANKAANAEDEVTRAANYIVAMERLRKHVQEAGVSLDDYMHLFKTPAMKESERLAMHSSGSHRPRIPAPSFKRDLAEFPVYYQRLKMKWAVDKQYPNADPEFIATVLNALQGPAAQFATSQVRRLDSQSAPTAESFLTMLYNKYNDPTAAIKARIALRDLRQGNKPLVTHIQKFEELLELSGCHEHSDFQKIELLKDTLSTKVMDVVYFYSALLPPTYEDWVKKVVDIEQTMRAADQHELMVPFYP